MKALRELVEAANGMEDSHRDWQRTGSMKSTAWSLVELREKITAALPTIERAEAIEKAAQSFVDYLHDFENRSAESWLEYAVALRAALNKGET